MSDHLDDARAEAERRYRRQRMHVGTPQDRERAAFVAGAEWAAGRAEVMGGARVVPTDLNSDCALGLCFSGCSHLRWVCDRCSSEGGWGAPRPTVERLAAEHTCSAEPTTENTEDVVEHAAWVLQEQGVGFDWRVLRALGAAGLLVTARTRPTRDDLILALATADGQPWPDGMDRHTAEHMYGKQADAVLALLDQGGQS